MGGKRGLGSQEATTETESQQRAAYGRIVLLSRLQMQPFLQTAVRGVGECRKLNADPTTRILPGNHSGGFDHGRRVRQRKGEGDKAAFLARRVRKPYREPALAKPRDGGLLALSILESEICGDINFQPDGPAPLSFQEGSGSSKTRLRLFGRDRLVDNKVRAQLKRSLQIGARVDNRDGHRFTVLLPGADAFQQPEAALVIAVNDDRFEAVLREFGGGADGIRAVLDMNFQFAQDTAKDAKGAVIRANQ